MGRGCRAAVVLTFSSAGACLAAGAMTVTTLPAAIWWAERAAAQPVAFAEIVPAPPVVVPTSPDEWFAPGGRNQGTEALADYLAALALERNHPLVVTSSWGRTWGPGTSDHHHTRNDSWAVDLAVRGVNHPTAATETAAQRIASALGEPGWSGGNLVKVVDGYRFQLLWLTSGHFDHVHLGVRRVG